MNGFDTNKGLTKSVGNPYNGGFTPGFEKSDQTEYDVLISRPVCSSTGVPVLDQRDEIPPD